MQPLRKPLLAAAGVATLFAGAALAADRYTHHVNVRLPDGSIAQVQYVGDVAPRVVLQPATPVAVMVAPRPMMAIGFPGMPQIDRIFAAMQARQAAMLQQVAAMEHQIAAHPGTVMASAGGRPGVSYTYVSSTTSSNGCTQTVQYSSNGAVTNGATSAVAGQPQVIRTSTGNCGARAVQQTPVHTVSEVKPQPATLPGKIA